MSDNQATTLCSLAMLKVNFDTGKDYLDYLRPYVLQVLSESPPEIISDVTVTAKLKQLCGLEIPSRSVQIVLQRLARDEYLRKDHRVYTVAKEIIEHDMTAHRVNAERHINVVTVELVRFAKRNSRREITEADAIECLVAFLSEFSIPCMKAYLRGTTLPTVNGRRDWQLTLASQFVNKLPSDPGLFDSFMLLVQGHMLANALLCPDLQSAPKSYKDVIFYFDTPLLIQLLGLEGTQEQQAISELIELVQQLAGTIACFSHTLEELLNVIRTSADYIDLPEGRGTIVDEARKSRTTKSDLILIAEQAEGLLEERRIRVVNTPPYDQKTNQFEIAEEVFASVLSDGISYFNSRAKEFDVKSVRSVYVLRRGTAPVSVEKCRAVLVTNNVKFARAAFEYGSRFEQSKEVSTVITDFSLANTAWLKAPLGAPSLPRKEVLAFAYAAMRPAASFWNKVLSEAEKLETKGRISSRDHQLLRSSHHAQSELMTLTLGDDGLLTDRSITETIERVEAEIKKEESVKFIQSEAARIAAEAELADERAKREVVKKRIFWRCDRRAKYESIALSIAIILSQFVVAVFGVFQIDQQSRFGWIMISVPVISGVIRIAGSFWDIKPLKAYQNFRPWRCAMLQRSEYLSLGIHE